MKIISDKTQSQVPPFAIGDEGFARLEREWDDKLKLRKSYDRRALYFAVVIALFVIIYLIKKWL